MNPRPTVRLALLAIVLLTTLPGTPVIAQFGWWHWDQLHWNILAGRYRPDAYSRYGYDTLTGGFTIPIDTTTFLYGSPSDFSWNSEEYFWFNQASLQPRYRYLNAYDSSGRLSSSVFQQYQGAGNGYVSYSRHIFIYDTAGYPSERAQSLLRSDGSERTLVRIRIARDAAHRAVEHHFDHRDSLGNWHDNQKELLTYNPAGKVISKITMQPVKYWPGWEFSQKEDTTYDASGLHPVLAEKFYSYRGLDEWVLQARNNFTLDAAGRIVVDSHMQVDYFSSGLQYDLKRTYHYDASDNILHYIEQSWDTARKAWSHEAWKQSFTYNSRKELTAITDAVYQNNAWIYTQGINQRRYHYHTANALVGAPQSSGIALSLSPQPAHDVLRISLSASGSLDAQCSILDLQGRVQQRFPMTGSGNAAMFINVSYLPAGNYVLIVNSLDGQKLSTLFTVAH